MTNRQARRRHRHTDTREHTATTDAHPEASQNGAGARVVALLDLGQLVSGGLLRRLL
jgi:hypothetical protein